MSDAPPIGVLLIQLGTPKSTDVGDVRTYLREFLGDPRVLDMPAPARALLARGGPASVRVRHLTDSDSFATMAGWRSGFGSARSERPARP